MSYAPSVPKDVQQYTKQLLNKGHGYPLHRPALSDLLPIECRDRGVSIGDVGLITESGGFDYLFNIREPRDHPVNLGRSPPNFEMVKLYNSTDLLTDACWLPPGESITSAYVKKTRLAGEVLALNA